MVQPSPYTSQYCRSDMVLVALHAVEADYTLVFFAAGGNHAPSWNWVWKAYRSLNRKYRKNLKQLVSNMAMLRRIWGEISNGCLYSTSYTLHSSPKVSNCIGMIGCHYLTCKLTPSVVFPGWRHYQVCHHIASIFPTF